MRFRSLLTTALIVASPIAARAEIVHIPVVAGATDMSPLGAEGPRFQYYPGWILDPPNIVAGNGAELCGAWGESGEAWFDLCFSLPIGTSIHMGTPMLLDPTRGAWVDAGMPEGWTSGLAGVRFALEGEWHFGWIGYQIAGPSFQFTAFAYETEPGSAITAGAVPATSGISALCCAAALTAGRRRRNARVR